MTPELLHEIGLNPTQARAYLCLVESGKLTPSDVADKTKQQRTTVYMALESLEKLGLVEETPDTKVKTYQATNPIALEKLSEERRIAVMSVENKVKQALPALLSYYYSFTERPGVRMVQGVEGLKEIYRDILRAKQDLYLLRTTADEPSMSVEFMHKFRERRAKLGIHCYSLTPDTIEARRHMAAGLDETWLFHRTIIPAGTYTAPVEIDVYGSKTAFLIFGEETMGVIVDSPQLAEAMRQIFQLLRDALPEVPRA